VAAAVKRLGAELSRDYAGKTPIMITVLKGAFIFMADLVREVTVPCTMDFMAVSSYGSGTKTSGQVKIIKDLDTTIEGKDVIIVEDILDSGVTLSYLIELLEARRPASLRLCALFDKPARHKVNVHIDYRGIEVPDEFIVGYGLDYDEKYRNLPDICVLKPEIYTK
jgi:hypoxanthine phosphoribosyltransferase